MKKIMTTLVAFILLNVPATGYHQLEARVRTACPQKKQQALKIQDEKTCRKMERPEPRSQTKNYKL